MMAMYLVKLEPLQFMEMGTLVGGARAIVVGEAGATLVDGGARSSAVGGAGVTLVGEAGPLLFVDLEPL